ncbi:MAG: hypothetical protein H7062_08865 [Candidatus Saccharimonas sp.]|nr:hypothetical protein [Planctomycetaceae bacterium]
MTTETLEQRVARLEEQMRVMVSDRADEVAAVPSKDWRRTVGMFRNDPIMKEIIEAGRRIREEDRQQAGS